MLSVFYDQGQEGGEFVFLLRQAARIEDLSATEKKKMKESEALSALEGQARLAEEKERSQIAQKEKELAELVRSDCRVFQLLPARGGGRGAGTDDAEGGKPCVRALCNSWLNPVDVQTVRTAKGEMRREWCASLPVEVGTPMKVRLRRIV